MPRGRMWVQTDIWQVVQVHHIPCFFLNRHVNILLLQRCALYGKGLGLNLHLAPPNSLQRVSSVVFHIDTCIPTYNTQRSCIGVYVKESKLVVVFSVNPAKNGKIDNLSYLSFICFIYLTFSFRHITRSISISWGYCDCDKTETVNIYM